MDAARFSLLAIYFNNDASHIEADLKSRPEHYGESYVTTLDQLRRKLPVRVSDTNNLVLQYMRKTEAAKVQRETTKKKTAEERRPAQTRELPAFEEQSLVKGTLPLI